MFERLEKHTHSILQLLFTKVLGRFPKVQKKVRAIYHKIGGSPIHQSPLSTEEDYLSWLEKTTLTQTDIVSIQRQIGSFKTTPLISIIMPVFNVDPQWIDEAISSIKAQIYTSWELCIVDDGSFRAETMLYLKSIDHAQIKTRFLSENGGIAAASNAAIQIATGEYIGLMDHDDLITRDALFECVKAINAYDPNLIYSDEDRVGEDGIRKKPFFKPDWSIDLLRTQNYICHFTVIKKSMLEGMGGFRDGFDGAQDYDLFLRIAEKTDEIYHLPKILYSWREINTSTTINPNSKPMAQSSGQKAVDLHLKRLFNGHARAVESSKLYVYDARYPVNDTPLISIIIPSKDQLGYLKNCLDSIVSKSLYENYEVIVLNNHSEKPETLTFLTSATTHYPRFKVVDAHYDFNWSKLNNHGMREAKGDLFVFLNNDTEVISEDWLERLAEQTLRCDIGAVGALLLYRDNTIQHAGVVVGMGGWADHVFKGMKAKHGVSGYVSPMVKRNVLAVTGSCLAISKKVIEKIGPFNEKFIVCGSDVELCLRAYENGLKNIFDPSIKLYHFESKTRIPENIPKGDFELSKQYYQKYWENGDPYYNINLSLMHTSPTLANPA